MGGCSSMEISAPEGGPLSGRVAVVTGAGSGLGRAVTERYLRDGASVVGLDISTSRLEHLVNSNPSGRLRVVSGDATTLVDNRRAVDDAVSAFGHLDVFVANTGFWDFGVRLEDLSESDLDAGFDELFSLNVKAHLAGAKAALGPLRAGRGSLILTASNAGLHPGGGGSLYTASKHAVVGLVRQLAYELAPEIRVNAVAPGGMKTALTGPAALRLPVSAISDIPLEGIISRVSPLGFLPDASDYAGWYAMLASAEDARTMTGAVIECDGGERVRGRAYSQLVRSQLGDVREHPGA